MYSHRMISISSYLVSLAMLFLFTVQGRSQDVTYLGQKVPGDKPVRFAKELITDKYYPHTKLVISPENDRIYFNSFIDLEDNRFSLYFCEFDGSTLSEPEADTLFDGKFGIKSFVFSYDGRSIFFGGQREYDKQGGNLTFAVWQMTYSDTTWSDPEPIMGTIDSNWASLGSVSINKKGDLYFVGRSKGQSAKIYCSKYTEGEYRKYELLPENVNSGIAIDPYIDPDDRFIVFSCAQRKDNNGIIDIYVSFKDKNGSWTEATNLGKDICTEFIDRFPMVTEDGKYLFFVTSHSNHFPSESTHYYWVDSKVIDRLAPDI